jgi:DnaJ-class molecular chaperone
MQQTNELQKLVEAVNQYRDIHSICESVPPANLKDWQKTKLHDAYVNMLIVCDAVQSSGLTKRAADTCPYCRGKGSVRHPNYGVSAVCPRCHGSGRAANARR